MEQVILLSNQINLRVTLLFQKIECFAKLLKIWYNVIHRVGVLK